MENISNWEVYAPYILIVLFFCFKNKIFVTPADLKDELGRMWSKMYDVFLTKNESKALKEDIAELKDTVNKIYDILIKKG